jgi:hypothetical protein
MHGVIGDLLKRAVYLYASIMNNTLIILGFSLRKIRDVSQADFRDFFSVHKLSVQLSRFRRPQIDLQSMNVTRRFWIRVMKKVSEDWLGINGKRSEI